MLSVLGSILRDSHPELIVTRALVYELYSGFRNLVPAVSHAFTMHGSTSTL
jgi:hypothetical protein